MAEELGYVDAVRAEIDKQLGWTPRHTYAEAWDQAVTTAMGVVGPILEGWEQRLADVRDEYRKSLESWDRSRARLDKDRALLLWLHAEAVWWLNLSRDEHEADEMLHVWYRRAEHATADANKTRAALNRSEASRQAWAEEAMRLQVQVDNMLAGAANSGQTWNGVAPSSSVLPDGEAQPGDLAGGVVE